MLHVHMANTEYEIIRYSSIDFFFSLHSAELQLSAGELGAALEEVQGPQGTGLGHEVVVRETHGGAALAYQPRVQGLQAGRDPVLHAARDVTRRPPVNEVLHIRDVVRVEAVHTCADHPGDLLNLETKIIYSYVDLLDNVKLKSLSSVSLKTHKQG